MVAYLDRIAEYLSAQSWQIAVLAVTVALLSRVLRNRSAHVRYLLWLIVLAKCLVPPALEVPVAVLPPSASPTILEPLIMPALEAITSAPLIPVDEGPIPAALTGPAGSAPLSPRQWLALTWLVGAMLFALAALAKAASTVQWLRRQRRTLPDSVRASTDTLLSSFGVRRVPRMWLIEGIGQPFVWGLVRGDIYLPTRFARSEDPQRQRDILGHELSHVLRFDAFVNTLQIVAQAIFWFHPFVWWANRKTRQEREKCCDEMAIARFGASVKSYSTAIVETLARAGQSGRPIPSLAVAGSLKHIEERIKTMLTPGKKFYKRPSLITAGIVLLAALVTVPTALVLTARAQTQPPKAKTNSPRTLHQAAAAGDIEQVQKLLAQEADVNAKDKDGRTPLHSAARYARKDVVAALLAQGANINEVDGSGKTPLHLASSFGEKLVPELLLAQGAQIDARDKAGNTPLHAAADRPEVSKDLLELLIAKGAGVKAINEAGQTPLHRVSMIRRQDKRLELAAEVLMAHGAEVDAKDQNGCTPLHFAVENGNKELVDLLVAKGADVKTKAADGTTLLHQAVKSEQLDMVELFLNRGIDINGARSDGRTALHLAASTGKNRIVEALIARGADVKARDVHGETPLQVALAYNRKDTVRFLADKGAEISSIQIAAYLGDLNAVKGFLERGGTIDTRDGRGLSPLKTAALAGQKDVAAFLISKGASVNADDTRPGRWTTLHCAALGGSKEIAELLIANGANVNAKTKRGITPLHFAAQTGATDVALLLIDHGADVNAEVENAGKWRPLDMAVWAGRRDIAKLLIDKGADTSHPDDLLFWACRQGDKDLAELLIQKGANVNSEAWGYAPAMQAIWSGYSTATKPADVPRLLGVLKTLLDHGADPDAKDRTDWSLLHYACEESDLAKLLLDKGANPNAVTNNGGLRPLHRAADKGRTAVVELLISRGADVNAKDFYGRTALWYAEDLGDNDMFGRPRKTPLTAEAKAAKQEVTRVLRERGARE
jgi:ankyrin repeat protein/beta-lactamase regulating signal transducer with metallopeptidase domain